MARRVIRAVLLAGMITAAVAAQGTVGVIRSRPLASPQEIANLEARVLRNPEDIDARLELLQFYLDTPPPRVDFAFAARGPVRLQYILYLVEHHPEAPASASRATYVYRSSDPYNNTADHDAVRDQWMAALQAHPGDNRVTMNAVKFLEVEDPSDAEQVLQRALGADPENRELAANLGFLYAKEILALDLADHAKRELEQSSSPVVLAAAGTALPNLAVKSNGGRVVDEKIFDFASELSTRARQLAPDDRDIQGPMPLIKYFVAAEERLRTGALPAPSPPSRIRVGENVQSANLIQKTKPAYPEVA